MDRIRSRDVGSSLAPSCGSLRSAHLGNTGNLVEKCGKRVFLLDETGKPAEHCKAVAVKLPLQDCSCRFQVSLSLLGRGFSNLQVSDIKSRKIEHARNAMLQELPGERHSQAITPQWQVQIYINRMQLITVDLR